MDTDTKTEPLTKARREALNMLARRDHTKLELTQKLKSKGHTSTDIATIINELETKKMLHEARFVENFIYWRRNRGYGPERIRQELIQKGITDEAIAEHLEIADNDWSADLRKVWQKHFKGKYPDNYKDKARQMRFLHNRGFTGEQINSIFDNEET